MRLLALAALAALAMVAGAAAWAGAGPGVTYQPSSPAVATDVALGPFFLLDPLQTTLDAGMAVAATDAAGSGMSLLSTSGGLHYDSANALNGHPSLDTLASDPGTVGLLDGSSYAPSAVGAWSMAALFELTAAAPVLGGGPMLGAPSAGVPLGIGGTSSAYAVWSDTNSAYGFPLTLPGAGFGSTAQLVVYTYSGQAPVNRYFWGQTVTTGFATSYATFFYDGTHPTPTLDAELGAKAATAIATMAL